MKLAVIGSRNFEDDRKLDETLNGFEKEIKVVVSGGAKGADELSEKWARKNDIPTKIFLPDHEKYHKGAYRIRNEQIAKECDELVAFWDGKSKGTKQTMDFAKKLNKKVHIINF